MSYYWFNRKQMQKAKEIYSNEKVAEYYLEKKRSNKEKDNGSTQNLVKRRKIQD